MPSQKIVILENTYYTVLSLRMDILRYFKNEGHEIYILSKAEQNDVELLTAEGFICRPVGGVVLNPFKAILFIFNLIREIKTIRPNIILSFTIRPNIFGSFVARWLNIPIVSNVTGTGPLTTDKSCIYALIRQAYKFAFQKNQRVFFQNKEDMQYFLSHNFVEKNQAKLLPGSGVDTIYFSPRKKQTNDFTFLMISRLIRDKGVVEYAEAAAIIRKQYPQIRCQILGPFWKQSISKNTISQEEIDDWQQTGIIEYLGYTNDVRPYIANADVIVLPSYREGCANVLMQGAAMAKPLIATDVTGCRNLIEDQQTGLLCQVKNSRDLADKMIAMYKLSNEDRIQMGEKGREKMIDEYQKSIVIDAYRAEVYV